MILERGRCVEFCHIRSGRFKHIEPHYLQLKIHTYSSLVIAVDVLTSNEW